MPEITVNLDTSFLSGAWMKGREFLSQYKSGPMPSGLRTREVLYIVI